MRSVGLSCTILSLFTTTYCRSHTRRSSIGDTGQTACRCLSHKCSSRLPVLSATPVVTFPVEQHHCPLASTKLHCLVTAVGLNNLPKVLYWESNLRSLDHKSSLCATTSPMMRCLYWQGNRPAIHRSQVRVLTGTIV